MMTCSKVRLEERSRVRDLPYFGIYFVVPAFKIGHALFVMLLPVNLTEHQIHGT